MKIKYLDHDVVIMHSAFVPFSEWLPALFFSDNHTAIAFLRGNLFFAFNIFLLSEELAFVWQHGQTMSCKYKFLCPHVCMRTDGRTAGAGKFYNEKKKILQEPAPLFPCLPAVLIYSSGLCVWHKHFLWICPLDFYLLKTWRFFPLEHEVRSYLFVRFVSSIVTSRIFTKFILLLYNSYKWSEGWEGDHWVTCFFLNYLHKNRQRFHKKNEGIILFENKKCKQ